jgi:Ca2+-binding RTX toxin-like protein
MAVTATFSNGTLTEFGDTLDNTITTSRDAAGTILVNGGAVAVTGGPATVANTTLIQVFGQGGADTLTLSEVNGALPAALLFGGAGDDTVTGGSGGDQLFGQADNDTLLGKGGNDFLFGGAGNDTLTGGTGDDQMFGESGDDRLIWNPGDGTDLVEGGDGSDTAEVNGGNGAEVFTITANGTRVRFDRLDPAPFSLDIGTTENIVINANGGDDRFSATGNLAALISITFDGGAGNDTILGSNGNDRLLGGADNDFVDGQQGNDTIFLGDGDDVFQWDPGDGSDIVEGQAGFDTMQFNGSAINEIIDISANGGRVRFTRDIATVTMDLNGVERIDFNALGGADTVKVHDLTGTDVTQVVVNLAGTLGGSTGDGAADQVIADATNGDNQISITAAAGAVSVSGLPAALTINQAEATDTLTVQGLGGNDFINATGFPTSAMKLVLDGGAGDDTLAGGAGADVFFGGDGNDIVAGRQGDDRAFLGAGNDTFVWNPGDGSDIVEGGDGTDGLGFRGAAVNEIMDISANSGRVRLTRDVANIVMDLDDVEHIEINALGGTDTVTVHDVTGTDLTNVTIDLAGVLGGTAADGQADQVIVQGTAGDDLVQLSGANGAISVTGLAALVNVTHADGGLDVLKLQTLSGADVVNASAVAAGQMLLQIEAGLGDDLVIGSAGNDLVIGGDGNDTAFLGAGDDTFVWNPGDDNDTIEGQAGFDVLKFNGANIAENIAIVGQNGRALLFRDVANVVMDTDGVERIDFNAFGGADNITVGNLAGTDVGRVSIDLAATPGTNVGDGAFDQVIVNATSSDDHVTVTASGSLVIVGGLRAQVTIDHAEVTDRLVVQGLDGNDFIEASTLPAGFMALTLDGGAGNDVLAGGGGNDLLLGGDGADLVVGRQGNDSAFLGSGNDSFIWNPGDGSDFIDGEAGFDTLTFRASNAANDVTVGTNGTQAVVSSNFADATLNVTNVERIEVNALGGPDNVTVNDQTRTDVFEVAIDLAANLGGSTGDGQVDHVTLNGGIDAQTIDITNSGGQVIVTGTPVAMPGAVLERLHATQTTIDHTDAVDQLLVTGGGGNDTLNASTLTPGLMKLTLDGGAGNDTLTGTLGADHFVFAFGNGADTITNFTHAAGDVIDLQGTGLTSFAQLQALMTDHGTFTTIDFGAGGSLNLAGLHPEQLQANDFLLS